MYDYEALCEDMGNLGSAFIVEKYIRQFIIGILLMGEDNAIGVFIDETGIREIHSIEANEILLASTTTYIDNTYNNVMIYRLSEIFPRVLMDCPKGQVVHHVDGNHLNNCYDNLVVLPRTEHRKLHTKDFVNKTMKESFMDYTNCTNEFVFELINQYLGEYYKHNHRGGYYGNRR